jgi:hypothetical protein
MKRICLLALLISGCGGGYTSPPAPDTGQSSGPTTQSGRVTGRYDVVLTSSSGHGTTSIHTNFLQSDTSLTGGANVICQDGDPSKCVEDDLPGVSITTSGTWKPPDISLTVSFPSLSGADTISVAGSLTGPGQNLTGTYTDTLGDSGTFTAFPSGVSAGPSLSGHFNSMAHPLSIAPMIQMSLVQSHDSGFHLTGSATITSFPCISSLTFTGQQVGDAVELNDSTAKVHFLMLPGPTNFIFSYEFDQSAPSCAGDFGQGSIDGSYWDYAQTVH